MPRKRRKKKPQLRKVLRIYCEGQKTEPQYLKSYLRCFKENGRAIVEVMPSKKNTPVQLVEAAIEFKSSKQSIEGDIFWVVYDRESESKYLRKLHVKAWNLARKHRINVALTNVCFEYWILLHFVDSARSYSSFEDLRSKSLLFSEVKNRCNITYDKASDRASTILFENIKADTSTACERANRINAQGMNGAGKKSFPFDINPYTDIPKLLEAIDNFR